MANSNNVGRSGIDRSEHSEASGVQSYTVREVVRASEYADHEVVKSPRKK